MVAAKWQQAVAWEIGLGGTVDFTPARVGQTLHLPCSRGHIVDFYINARMPPEAVAKKLMQKGWSIGSKLCCPKHARKSKKSAPGAPTPKEDPTMATELPEAVELPAPPVSVKPAPSDAAKAKRREALQWLSESFNVEKGAYASGVSDASIAKETGLAENAVAQLREEFYGPLKEPEAVAQMRAELAALKTRIADREKTTETEIRAFEARFGRICDKNGWEK